MEKGNSRQTLNGTPQSLRGPRFAQDPDDSDEKLCEIVRVTSEC